MVKRHKSLKTDEHKQIAQRLAQARDAAGLSQSAVARALQESQTWVSKIETGRRRVDTVELRRLCLLYGVDANSIVMPEYTAGGQPGPTGGPSRLPSGPSGAIDTSGRAGPAEEPPLRKVADQDPPRRGGKAHHPRYRVPRGRKRAARPVPKAKRKPRKS